VDEEGRGSISKGFVPELGFSRTEGNVLVAILAGDWKLENDLPAAAEIEKQIGSGVGVERLVFDAKKIHAWDSGLLTFLITVIDRCSKNNVSVEKEGLPEGVRRLLELASAVPERKGARRGKARIPFLERIANTTIGACVLLLLFAGCASTKQSRFYTLDIGKSSGIQQPSSVGKLSIALGPVEIPDYLDRPQIVIRTSNNELMVSEFDRWAGSLQSDTARVLTEALALLLSERAVSVSSWEWSGRSDCRISVDIRRFDIMPDGNVLINAQWSILGKDGAQILLRKESTSIEPITAQTYQARASSMSSALEKLSRDIAAGITSVVLKK
jgi:uncharacterized lipoprotein YmbA/ABC-type transporter Mla MlaB component